MESSMKSKCEESSNSHFSELHYCFDCQRVCCLSCIANHIDHTPMELENAFTKALVLYTFLEQKLEEKSKSKSKSILPISMYSAQNLNKIPKLISNLLNSLTNLKQLNKTLLDTLPQGNQVNVDNIENKEDNTIEINRLKKEVSEIKDCLTSSDNIDRKIEYLKSIGKYIKDFIKIMRIGNDLNEINDYIVKYETSVNNIKALIDQVNSEVNQQECLPDKTSLNALKEPEIDSQQVSIAVQQQPNIHQHSNIVDQTKLSITNQQEKEEPEHQFLTKKREKEKEKPSEKEVE